MPDPYGEFINLTGNPLSAEARNTHVPALRSRGVRANYWPVIVLTLSPSTIGESGSANRTTVTATRYGEGNVPSSPSATEVFTVSATAEAPAVADDFSLSSNALLTFESSSWNSTSTVTITAVDDEIHSGSVKRVTVSATKTSGNAYVTPPLAVTLTITADETMPTVTLLLSPASISEYGGVSTVTATIDHASSVATTVTVAAMADTPAVSNDFALSSADTLIIAAGQTTSTGTVTITAVNNEVSAPNKTIAVSATATNSQGINDPSDLTLTIFDDETPTATLAVADTSISENGRSTTVTATLSHASGAATTIVVRPVADAYAVGADSTIVIAAGQTENTSDTVTITAVDNAQDAPDRTVTVSGVARNSRGVSRLIDTALTLTDDEATPTVTLLLSPASISEYGGLSYVIATLDHASSAATTVTVSATEVPPAVSNDFALSAATTLTIAPGETRSTDFVSIRAEDNAVVADNVVVPAQKTVTVSATAANSQGVNDPTDVTLTITDDDNVANNIPDDSLRVVIERRLGKTSGATITQPEMRTLTTLDASGKRISDLTGLEYATGLTDLDLSDNAISDISALSGLTGLTDLDLSDNAISDITILLNVTSLTDLDLSDNAISRISALSYLTSLKNLYLRNNRISDIEPLVDNSGLRGEGGGKGGGPVQPDYVYLRGSRGNPLSAESRNTHIPALEARGVTVSISPEITLALSPPTIGESGSTTQTTITATLDAVSSATTTITVSATAVAPAGSGDFTLSDNAILTIPIRTLTSTGTVTITAENDAADTPDKRVTVAATAYNSDNITPPLAVTLTIADDETTPMVTLLLSPASISENGGVSTVTATIDHASSVATTVTVAAMADTPAVSNDFALSSADTLIIAAGQTTSTGTVTITAVNNEVSAPNKTIAVSATATNSQGINDPSNATLTILDDDTPTVVLAVADTSISENGGSTTVTATLSPSSSAATTIVVRPIADAYAVGADSTIVIAAGQTENTSDTVTITAVDNAQDAPDRAVTVSGVIRNSAGVNRLIGAALTITDDEAVPMVTLLLSPASISENGGVSTVTATLDHASSVATTITVSATEMPPAASSDFALSRNAILTIAPGETASADTVTITAVDNTVSAADKTVTVSATAANSYGVTDPSNATLTITDDESTIVSIPDDSLRVVLERRLGKASGAAITRADMRTLTRLQANRSGISDLTGLEYATGLTRLELDGNRISAISALSGLTALTELNLDDNRISAISALSGLTALTSLDLRNNRVTDIEPLVNNGGLDGQPYGEFINLTGNPLSAEARNTHVPALRSRGVRANYWPVIVLTLSPSTIGESGSANRTTVTATRYGEGNVLSKPSATEVFTVSATAEAPAMADDFSLSNNALLTFESSSWNSTSTVTITAVDDEIHSGSVKRVTVSATKTSGNAYVTPPLAVTLTITDDDGTTPTVTLLLSPASISENGGVSTVTATLDHASIAATTVTVTAMARSPATPNDFALSSADTLIIAAGQTTSTGTVTITAVNNAQHAPNKAIAVSATATNSQGINDPSDLTLTIFDDETPTATLAVADTSISENGGSTTVTATLSEASSAATTIVVRPIADAYAVGADSTIVIAAGQTANALDTVTITAVDNAQDAPDRAVTVSGVARNSRGVSRLIAAALTLTDDEATPTVTLLLSPASISEYGGLSYVKATLDHASSAATTVTVSATEMPPAASSDFALSRNAILTIAPGETASADTVTITAVDNMVSAAAKTVTVSATAANSQGVINPSNITLTITDDESPISIPDDSLRVVLERALGKTSGAAISGAEMRTLTTLNASGKRISDLTGLEYATGLTDLDLSDNAISAISALSGLTTGLTDLDLSDNAISAISDLSGLTGLTDLGLSDNAISDISALSGLTGLTGLQLDDNRISDISALSGLTNLTGLQLDDNRISAISALSGLTNLTGLQLSGNRISDISALSGLTNLTGLHIRGNRISDIEPLLDNPGWDGHPWSETIEMAGNPLSAESRNTHAPALRARGVRVFIAPEITLMLSSSTIDEGGVTTVTASLGLSVSALTAITVSATAVAPATANDFSLSANTILTFMPRTSSSTGTVTITAVNDEIHGESDKRVILSAARISGDKYVTPSLDVTLTITEDDGTTPTVTLLLSPASISENGGVSTVTATLDYGSIAATTIAVTAMARSPATPNDFALSSADTLIIAAGEMTSTGTFTITAVNNAQHAPNKTITVSATAVNSIGINDPLNATLTIFDDDTPTATLAVADTSISENGGSTTVTATLSEASSAATTIVVRPVADAYAVGADSAIVIAAGQTANALDTVPITAVDNAQDAPDRAVTVSGVARNSRGVSRLIGAALTLTDDDAAPMVTLLLSPASISEYGGVSYVKATLAHASSAATTITVSATEVPPAVSSDFALSAATTLTIAPGETASADTVTITAVDNMVSAAAKTVTVSATAANSQGVINPSNITLTITDDEATVTIPDDSLRVVIERALGKTSGAAISGVEMRTLTRLQANRSGISDLTGLEYATGLTRLELDGNRISAISALSSLTALTELDLDDNRISAISALSSLTALTSLNIRNNRVTDIEPLVNNGGLDGRPYGEFINLTGNPLSAEARNTHVPALRSRGVEANYWPVIKLVLSPLTINESGSGNQTTVSAQRWRVDGESVSLKSPSLGSDVVTVSARAEAPAAANDFTLSTDKTLTFTPETAPLPAGVGRRGLSSGTVTITAVDDEDHNLDKRVIVSGTVSSEREYVTPPLDLILTIDNDDAPRQVTLVLTPSTISESGAGNETTVTATLNRTSSAATTITVSATAVAPAVSNDFTLSSARTLTIAAGRTTSTGAIAITAVNNAANAPPKQITVSATVQNSQGVGDPTDATLTITDDDAPTVTLLLTPSTIDESGAGNETTVTATLNRTSSAATTITVSATAVAPAVSNDFTLSSARTLIIAAGQTTSTGAIAITAVDNAVSAADKRIAVSATAANSMGVNDPSNATLTIVDDDALVTIPDANLRAVIEDSLGKSRGATISRAEMRTLTRLFLNPYLSGGSGFTLEARQIADLTGLEFAADLTELFLDRNNVSDLSPLRNLTNLTLLSLNFNKRVSDLSPLSNLPLRSLSLENNDLTAPYPSLRNLTNLQRLFLKGNALTDLSLLSNLTGLIQLSLSENDVSDLSPLSNLTGLTQLSLYRNDVSDLSPLQNLDNLSHLTLATNDISDLSPLLQMPNLRDVHLTGNPMSAESRNTHIPTLTSRGVSVTISPEVSLVLSSSTINEGSSGNVTTVTATMDMSYGHLGTTITVSTGFIEGTEEFAIPRSSDFTLSSNRELIIADRATTSTGLVTITATDDQVSEFSEKLAVSATIESEILERSSTIILAITPPLAVPLTIIDNDNPAVHLEVVPTTISENGGMSKVTATLTRASSAATTVSLRMETDNFRSAYLGTDYTLSGNSSLTIDAGATTTTDTLTITALDNTREDPPPARTITVYGTATSSQDVTQPPALGYVVSFLDDDPAVAYYTLARDTIDESGANNQVIVTASLIYGVESATTITVSATAAPPALPGDFTMIDNAVMTIAAMAKTSTDTVRITAVDNTVDEPDKTVMVSATVQSSHSQGMVPYPPRSLTIRDDDAAPTVMLAVVDTSISENGGSTNVTATLSHASSALTTITLRPVTDAYSVGSDSTIVIAAGQTANASDTVAITAVDNTRDEANREVTVSGVASNDQGVGAVTGADLTLTDDDAAPRVTLSLSSVSISEGGGVSTVTAKLDLASSEATAITVSASPVDPAVANDFNLSNNKVLTIAAGDTTSTGRVTITAVDNTTDAPDKTVTVSGVAANSQGATNPVAVTLTLTDDEATPQVTLSLSSVSISEGGGVSTVTAKLDLASSEATAITVSASPVLPAVANDFNVSNNKVLTIAAGDTTSTGRVTITAVDNTINAPDKTVTVSGIAANSQGATDPVAVTLTLTDDEATPQVTLALSPSMINESGSPNETTVTATLDHASSAVTTVTVSASPGANAVTADFNVSNNKVLTIAAGDTTSTGRVTITAVDNTINAPNKTVTVSGTATNSQGATNPANVTLTIIDDETPQVTLVLSPPAIDESGATNRTTVTATLNLASTAATTVTVSAAPGANAVATDFTLSSADTLLIAAGDMTSTGLVTITAVDDTIDAPNKTVTVSPTVQSSQDVRASSDVTLTIRDDEAAPTVTLAVAEASIAENGGSTNVTATLSHASSAITTITLRPVTDAYSVGSDSTIVIAAGQTANISDTVAITAVDNTRDEANREVTVSGVASNDQGVGAVTGADLTLTDDDAAPRVMLAVVDTSISESGGSTNVTATLSHASSAITTITLRPVIDAYSVGSDSTIVIAAGQTANASDTVAITAVDNTRDEVNREVTVSGVASNDQGVGEVTGADLTLTDDDAAPTVMLAVVDTSISESGGSTNVTATLSHASSAITTITVRPVTDAYSVGSDSTIVIAAGQTANASDTVAITAVDNTRDEANREVTVSGVASNDQGVGAVTGADLTLTDDDAAPRVTLSLSSASISEGGGVSTVTAKLDLASSAATAITVSASPVLPAVANDFNLSNNKVLTIAAGDTTSTGLVTITAVDNTTDAPDKTVTVSGTAANSQGVTNPANVTLTIRDDEDPPRVTLSLSSASISEGGGVSTVTAKLDLASSEATAITVSASPVLPAVANDFNLSNNKVLTIAAGDTTSTGLVTITAVDNTTDAPDKTVTVSGVAANSQGVTNPVAVTLTLTDDEATPQVTLALSPSMINESGSPNETTVTATLDHASSAITTVTVSAAPGANAVAADFNVSNNKVLTIAAGDTTSTGLVTITAVDNTINAPNKTVTVSGTATNSQGATDPANVTLTIIDDETPQVTLVLSPPAIDESGATNRTTVTATLNLASTAATTVTVSASPGANAVATDFTLSSADTLLIAAGEMTSTGLVTITAVDDTTDAPNKTVTVSPTVQSSQDVRASSDVTLTIRDDDAAPTVMLAVVDTSISENGGSTNVTATLSHASSAITTITLRPVTDAYSVGSDSTIVIAAGQTENASDTVAITAVDNTRDEANREVTVSGVASNDQGVGAVTGADLTLTDDDAAPRVMLAVVDTSISESGGSTNVTATLSHASSAITTITLRPVIDAYSVGSDSTIVIAAGQTANASDTVAITAVDNTRDEVNREVTVSGVASNDQGVGEVTGADLTLTDDDAAPTVMLAVVDTSISENGGSTNVTATLSHASSAITTITLRPVTDAYSVGSDSTIVIAAGQTANASDTVAITAVDNTRDEANREVTVSGVASNDQGVGAVTGADLTLTDDDAAPRVTLSLSSASISEGGGVSTVTAKLDLASSAATAITVSASPVDPAVANDFNLSNNKVLTIAAGDTTSTGRVTITAVDNTTDAPDKTVTVSGTAANSQGVTNPANVTLTIRDDEDPPRVTLSLSSASISEGGGVSTVTAKLDLASSAATAITVSASPGANAVMADFNVSNNKVLTIAAGDTTSTGLVTITAVDNSVNAPDKTVTVSGVAANSHGATNPVAVTLTLTDDEATPQVTLALSPSMINESGSPNETTVTATLDHASSAITTVTVSASPGANAVTNDFNVSNNKVLTIAAGDTTSTGRVTITAVDNTINAPNKTVTVSGTATNSQGATDPANVTLTIIDDETPQVTLVLSPPAIDESGATNRTTVTATLNLASSAVTTVTVSATPRSGDFALSNNKVLLIAAGATNSTGRVTITAVDNATDAPNKTVTVSATAQNSQGVGKPSDVTLTIADDDAAPKVMLVLSPETINESGAPDLTTITATLSHASSAVTTVTVSAAPGENAVSGDFALSDNKVLLIAAGATNSTGTVTIAAVPNVVDDPNKTVTVSATAQNSQGVMAPLDGTLTITDDVPPPVADDKDAPPVPPENTMPTFTDAVDFQRYRQGTPIPPLTFPIASDGDGALTYGLTPPPGLTYTPPSEGDMTGGVLSGTPTEPKGKTIYALTATDEDGDEANLSLFIVVMANRMPSFGDTMVAAQSHVQNRESEAITLPRATGGDSVLTYALTPDLPEGLAFDAETRVLSGMPTEAMAETTYALTATDRDGDVATLTFNLSVAADRVPSFGDATVAALRYAMRMLVRIILPEATGGDGMLAYLLFPSLPEGLSFDHEARMLSGMPTEATAEATYTLTALDADGDVASLLFTLEVRPSSADLDGDGVVNFADFIRFVAKYGTRRGEEGYDSRCDLNGDGAIDFDDFLILKKNFGTAAR